MKRLAGLPHLDSANPRAAGITALLVAVLLAAAAFRAMRAPAGLPYLHEWDEPLIASRALRMLQTGDYNPHAFEYGSLTIYLNLIVDVLHYLWLMRIPEGAPGSLRGLDDIRTFFDSGWLWTVSHPSFYLWNRGLTAAMGTASVGLVYLLARRIAGAWAGLLAASFLAGLEYHIAQSALVLPNVAVSTFTLLVALLSILYLERRRPVFFVMALVACGLAASAKYNAAISVVVPMVALVGSAFRRPSRSHPWLWAALVIVPPIAFLAGTPYAALDLNSFLTDLGKQAREYFVLGHGRATVEPGAGHLFLQIATISELLGIAGSTLAVLGVARMCYGRSGRIALLLPIVYLLWMSRTRISFHRNFVLIYPFAAVAIGCGGVLFHRLVVRAGGRFGLPGDRVRLATGLALLAFSIQGLGFAAARSWSAWTLPESRTQAVRIADSLIRRVPASRARLGIAEELRVHAIDLAELSVAYHVAPLPDLLCEPSGTYALVMTADRYTVKEPGNRPDADLRNELLLSIGRPQASVGTLTPFDLDGISPNPAIILAAPALPDGRGLECDATIPGSRLASHGDGELSDEEGGRIELNGSVSTPTFSIGPGSHALSVRANRSSASSRRHRLRATLLQRAADGRDQPMDQREIGVGSEMASHLVRFQMDRQAMVTVRLELIEKARPSAPREDIYASVDSVRVIALPAVTASSPRKRLSPPQ